jgi:hypothetical protein
MLDVWVMKFISMVAISVVALAALCLLRIEAVRAERLVDPSTVAPEFRAAAETRRAEQLKQQECGKKAQEEKVLPRERTAFLLKCLEN